MTTTRSRWLEKPERLPDGHRLFTTYDGCIHRFAVADDSSYFPEYTEDGVLWLDFSRPLAIGGLVTIPLFDDDGKTVSTPSDVATLLYLAARFGWAIEDRGGKTYQVTSKQSEPPEVSGP